MSTDIYEKIMTDLEFDRDNLEEVWRKTSTRRTRACRC
ncbi:Uncharacterised protein [Klebsiella pneumoniae]|nr:Uncharacterised protein [Klebsiella pneumoniae]